MKSEYLSKINKAQNINNFSQSRFKELKTSQDIEAKHSSPFNDSSQKSPVSPAFVEAELKKAIAQISHIQRYKLACKLLEGLKNTGYCEHQLDISTHSPKKITSDEICKLATYAYQKYPSVFQEVLAEQPQIVKLLSITMINVILSIMAAKWLGNDHEGK